MWGTAACWNRRCRPDSQSLLGLVALLLAGLRSVLEPLHLHRVEVL